MNDSLWSDDEFRSFATALYDGGLLSPLANDSEERAAFRRQAELRVAPEVQRRVLAEVGAVVDVSGIGYATLTVLEEQLYTRRRAWIMVTPDPWALLADLVARDIRSSYRATVRHRADTRTLTAIAHASTRAPITRGDSTTDDTDLE